MPCQLCTADPRRPQPGTNPPRSVDRRCAFDQSGRFDAINWCCLTLDELCTYAQPSQWIGAFPHQIVIVPGDPSSDAGWIVMTQHGWHHSIQSAVHMGDHEPRVLTQGVAEQALAYWRTRKAAEAQVQRERQRITLANASTHVSASA
jgi:hypothetical protein